MAFVRPRDRVQELSTSNSQTVFAVTGAIDSSYNNFASAMGVGDTTIGGVIEPGVAFKSGLLTYSATNQVTVTTAFESKGTFSTSGTKFVFMGMPALEAQIQPNQVGGKLTLASGVATMRSSIAAASAVLFTPTGLRGTVPVPVNGGAFWYDHMFSETTQNLTDTTKSPAAAIPNAIYDYWGWMDGSTWRATRSDWWKKSSAGIQVTAASPAVVTWTGNDFDDGAPIFWPSSLGTVTGLTPGTIYFVKQTTPGVISNTFNVSATPGGAAINTGGSTASSLTATGLDKTGAVARNVGGNSEIDFAKLFPLNKNAITNGPGALAGVYLGSVMTNAAGTVDHIFCTRASNFGAGWFGVWNAWNREEVPIGICADSSSANYGSSNTTMNAAHNSPTARFTMIRGLDAGLVRVRGNLHCSPGSTSVRMICGFGLDTTGTLHPAGLPSFMTSGVEEALNPVWEGYPGMGKHFISLNEKQNLATASSWRTIDIMDGIYPLGFTGSIQL